MAKIQKIKNILKYLCVLTMFYCCSKNHDELKDNDLNKIVDSVYKNQQHLNFKNIIKTKWDKMYILDVENFPELSSRSGVSRTIGLNYDGCKNDALDRSILFVSDNKIVCEICSNFKETNWEDSQYYVNFILDNKTKYYTPENAVFRIEKKNADGFNLIHDLSSAK